MRSPGMALPGSYMDAISAGPAAPMACLDGAIGTAFLTPEQGAFRAQRAKYGSTDDPDAGGYHLNQIDWDKDSGSAEVGALEAGPDGWYSPGPGVHCGCPPGGTCGCQ